MSVLWSTNGEVRHLYTFLQKQLSKKIPFLPKDFALNRWSSNFINFSFEIKKYDFSAEFCLNVAWPTSVEDFSAHTVLVHSCRKCAYWLVKNMSWLCSHCLNSLIIYFSWLPESTFDINNAVSTWELFPCKVGGRRLWPLSSRLIWVILNQSYMYPHTH